jgi:hypothetical protein
MANAKISIGQLIKADRAQTAFILLTTEQMQAVGKAVMTDARCTPEVKADVRSKLTGKPGTHTYTTSEQHTWYDALFVAAGVAK